MDFLEIEFEDENEETEFIKYFNELGTVEEEVESIEIDDKDWVVEDYIQDDFGLDTAIS